MTNSRQALGRWGEDLAADYLTGKEYRIIERNFRTPYGEIDLIARLGVRLIFVEVKTRSSDAYGPPEASITQKKRQHLIEAALFFLQINTDQGADWQIDVIAIRKIKSENTPEITHFENAIS